MPMHEGELTVAPETVRALVDAQFPAWRRLPVRPLASSGTVNAIFRLGDRLTARFPRQPQEPQAAGRWLAREADAAREMRGRTRFPTPEPVALGRPGAGYPLPWSVQTWLPGVVATVEDPGDSYAFADDLAEFVTDVRAIDTGGRTFDGSGRGGVLLAHDEWMQTCLRRSEGLLDVPLLRRFWTAMRELPRGGTPDRMSHTDLIPGNVLVRAGRLAGVLDVGGSGPADPALDLVGGWHLLEAGPRSALRERLGCDDLTWERGRAWAFEQAMGLVWYYRESNPVMSRLGRRTLERITADPPPG
ncbi:aminoglycoside phosphotransferase family protein [Micromonospora sp. RP3T]|uniref:aminoglycoside phosphotransferase family protein n=1 Tax=Micromonospora sp. RP3T TaxID=2135446 RepID=UPI001E497AA3|nr:aminoglycoside phosphotransferase family protein [Micromonospora sp. RP3T]